jgi:hypothetical protein
VKGFPRTKRIRRSVRLAVAGGLATAVTLGAAPALASAATPEPVSTPGCAWRIELSPTTVNAFLPDSNAVYWIMPYRVQTGVSITLKGTFAAARYTSLTTYTKSLAPFTKAGVSSDLNDFHIQPDAGSTNPWQAPAKPGGHFTVTLQSYVSGNKPNVLPIAPAGTAAGTTGYVVYRVYLPAGTDASIALPAISFHRGGKTINVPTCSAKARSSALPADLANASQTSSGSMSAAADASTGTTRQFARKSSSTGSLFPNPDNGYLSTVIAPPGTGKVVVIRAKAPTTPGGELPVPWPAGQLRYWSLCTYVPVPPLPVVTNTLPDGSVDTGCRADTQTSLDSSGYYTFALGTEAQRAAIGAIPGVTFVPFSTKYASTPHQVLLRNLIPNFPKAVQNVPANFSPASAVAVMGDYYPRTAVCSLTTLTNGGPTACVPTPAG